MTTLRLAANQTADDTGSLLIQAEIDDVIVEALTAALLASFRHAPIDKDRSIEEVGQTADGVVGQVGTFTERLVGSE